MDITPLLTYSEQVIAIVLMAGLSWGVKRGLDYLGIKETEAEKAELEDVTKKGLAFAFSQANALIAAKGWDHSDVKSQVVADAINYTASKFPEAMTRSGIDLTDPTRAAQQLGGITNRLFASAAATAAASPATPPAPTQEAPPATTQGPKQ